MAKAINIPVKTTGASKATSDLGKVDKSVDGLSTTVKGLAAAFIGVQSLRFFQDISERAGRLDTARLALDNLTGSAEKSAEFITAMGNAVNNTIARTDLMSISAKLLSLELATTSQEAADLTELAVKLGAAIGKDATGAIEEFTLLLANQSILRLDTFGISGSKVRERMAELAETTKELTREQRFLQATFEIGNEKLKTQDNILEGVQGGNSALIATIRDLTDILVTELTPSIVSMTEKLTRFIQLVTIARTELWDLVKVVLWIASIFLVGPLFKGIGFIIKSFKALFLGARALTVSILNLGGGFRFLQATTGSTIAAIKGTFGAFATIIKSSAAAKAALQLLGISYLALKAKTILNTAAQKLASAGTETFTEIVKRHTAAMKLWNVESGNVASTTTEIVDSTETMMSQWADRQALQQRTLDIQTYLQGLIGISNELVSINDIRLDTGEISGNFQAIETDITNVSATWLNGLDLITNGIGSIGNAWAQVVIQGEDGWKAFETAGKAAIAQIVGTIVANAAIMSLLSIFAPGVGAAAIAGGGGFFGSLFGGVKFAANGMNETVTKPTMIVAGEQGPEHVRITPNGQSMSNGNITFNINTLDADNFEKVVNRKIIPMINRQRATGNA